MRISFRQGIVSHQTSGFLQINVGGNVSLNADNRPVVVTVAHEDSNYLHSEDISQTTAWVGPFLPTEKYWLYWDFDQHTFQRSFGHTTLEPVAQAVEPGLGNANISGVIPGGPGVGSFVFPTFYNVHSGFTFVVQNSTGNDGTYTVASASFDGLTGETVLVVNETVADATIDGTATLDIDSDGQPLRQVGRTWFDTVNNIHFEWMGSAWRKIHRVYAAALVNGNTFISPSVLSTSGGFTGTQIGNNSSNLSGRVVFDEAGSTVKRDNGTFFTTEDQMFSRATRVDAVRLESNVARAKILETAIAEFTIVAWVGEGIVETAQYEDAGNTVVGVILENTLYNETSAIVTQGSITNPTWDWTHGIDATSVGQALWVDNGLLVTVDPHVTDPLTYPTAQVPVARVLSQDTIIFEQGLGGIGARGPAGSIANFPPATLTEIGGVTLLTPSTDPAKAIVISDTDPRLTDARPALPHTHSADQVTFVPASGITANNVQGAIEEVNTNSLSTSGGTLTGPLILSGSPTTALEPTTKQYVDDLVSGLVWLNPVSLVNLISDNVTTPPAAPNVSDAYIIPSAPAGSWSGIAPGNLVVWDGLLWLDGGAITAIPNKRFGISVDSSTVPSGSFAGHANEIALYDVGGVLTGFEVPTQNNAVYVNNVVSQHAFDQFAFDGTDWILFGGGAAVTSDGTTTVLQNNVLSVIPHSNGGTVDAELWQGLVPADLDLVYAQDFHNHTSSDVSVTAITGNDFGTASYSVPELTYTASDVQTSIERLMDTKAMKRPMFASLGDLPAGGVNNDGMLAVVDDAVGSDGGMYYSRQGSWNKVSDANHTHNIPYDINYFIGGPLAPGEIVGSIVATRNIRIQTNAPGSYVVAETPINLGDPSMVFDILLNGVSVGSITFNSNDINGTILFTDTTILPGQKLQIRSPAPIDLNLRDITIAIVGCATATNCVI